MGTGVTIVFLYAVFKNRKLVRRILRTGAVCFWILVPERMGKEEK